jgi:hypothetical protein
LFGSLVDFFGALQPCSFFREFIFEFLYLGVLLLHQGRGVVGELAFPLFFDQECSVVQRFPLRLAFFEPQFERSA